MHYIIIQSLGGQTSEARATEFTRELYKISRPTQGSDATLYWWGVIKHPVTGECAIAVDLDELTYIHENCNLNRLKALLNPSLANPGEVNDIIASINGKKKGQIAFRSIIPSYVTVYDYAQMDSLGWFPVPSLN